MKTYKYLYKQMLEESVIRKAYKKLRKRKTKRQEIKYIDAHMDEQVKFMQDMIQNTKPPDCPVEHPELAFKPKKKRGRKIWEHGKERTIYCPNIYEQWMHHIIVVVLEPIITRSAYRYSCGSFPKRGGHYGKRALERWIKKGGRDIKYYAKVDIRHFYDSIRLNILMRELRRIIKDEWFLYILELCFFGFKKGIPLGFYLSQWLANFLLQPLDYFITQKCGIKKYLRYMDDICMFAANKKKLHEIMVQIKMFLGRRFRLKLKDNHQVARFMYQKKNGKVVGRFLDIMGFVFKRERVIIRERIMLAATRLARHIFKLKQDRKKVFRRLRCAMLSYMGWFTHTDTYDCYTANIKPFINVKQLKQSISREDKEANRRERMAQRAAA